MGRAHKARAYWAAIPPWKRREIKAQQQRDNAARLREQCRQDRAASTGAPIDPDRNGSRR